MADDVQTNLDSYYLQLQQVDAALTSQPDNEELLKLKKDLEEVIELTKELLTQQLGYTGPEDDVQDEKEWQVGDKCLAPWSEDGKHYEALIEEIHPEGKVSVGFVNYAHGEVIELAQLKPLANTASSSSSSKSSSYATASSSTETPSSSGATKRSAPKETIAERKQALLKQKEYLKKRKQKKLARVEEQEKEREKDKKKWLNFSTKKGLMNKKKSIFASPETVGGRVGVGTCGVSGKGITPFTQAEKWRKGWK